MATPGYPTVPGTTPRGFHSNAHNVILDARAHFGVDADNADNTSRIQEAIDAIPHGEGVEILLPPGVLTLAGGLEWNKDTVSLAGHGANGTQLKFTGGDGIVVGDGVEVRNGVGFRNLTIRGNQTTPNIGLHLKTCWQVDITNVNFSDFAVNSLRSDQGGHQRVIACQGSNNAPYTGTYFLHNSVVVSDFLGCTFESDGGTAINLAGGCMQAGIVSCHHRGNKLDTFIKVGGTGAEDLSVMGCTGTGLEEGIDASDGGTGIAILGNTLRGSTPAGSAIHVGSSGVHGATVVGNTLRDWGDAIIDITSAEDVSVIANHMTGTGRPVFDNSSGTTGLVAYNTWPSSGTPTRTSPSVRWIGNTGTDRSNLNVVATGSLPAAAAAMDGTMLIEDAGAGNRNLIIYAGGERFRIDGGANV